MYALLTVSFCAHTGQPHCPVRARIQCGASFAMYTPCLSLPNHPRCFHPVFALVFRSLSTSKAKIMSPRCSSMPDSAHYAQVDHWPALRYAALVLQMSSRTRASGDAREPGPHAGATNAPSASAEDQLAAQFGQLGLANQHPAFLHLRGDLTTFLREI